MFLNELEQLDFVQLNYGIEKKSYFGLIPSSFHSLFVIGNVQYPLFRIP